MKIHKEGYSIIAFAFLLFVAIDLIIYFTIGYYVFLPLVFSSIILLIFVIRFFRVPFRSITKNDTLVYSPADGTIVAIEEIDEDEYLNAKCIQVSIFMSVWNVHINWFPFKGVVKYYKYHPGKFLVAKHPKSSTLNERTSVAVQRNDGVVVMMRQIAGAVARRIVCYAIEGKNVEQCSELGFIKFGSRVDLFLPLNSDIKVKLNQKVTGTQTAIADIPIKKL